MIIKKYRHHHLLFLLLLVWSLLNSSVLAQKWESEYYRDHALVGKIWDSESNSWLNEKQLILQASQYDYVLIGETHNNADHHRLQSQLLNLLVAAGAKPVVVMEMLEIDSWQDKPRMWKDLNELQEQAKTHNPSWPWKLYAPILQSVVEHQLELVAGNISSDTLHERAKELGPFRPDEIVDEYLVTYNALEQLKQDIVDSHCGYANDEFVNFMIRAQFQRDHVMTMSLVNNEPPVVLIAGSGHVRNNYAVPMQLLNNYMRISYISISFIQVNPNLINPNEYINGDPNDFDILIFTPSYTDQDPCERYRKELQKLQKSRSH